MCRSVLRHVSSRIFVQFTILGVLFHLIKRSSIDSLSTYNLYSSIINIPNFFPPLDLVQLIFSTIIFLSKQSIGNMCPSQLLFLFFMLCSETLFLLTFLWLFLHSYSLQSLYSFLPSILLWSHISKFSKYFSSFFLALHLHACKFISREHTCSWKACLFLSDDHGFYRWQFIISYVIYFWRFLKDYCL